MKKRVTIKDVAALAGVSFATVSRALDDRPEISRETKEKVRSACMQLGYVPNAAARGLTGQSTHTIGVIVPDISNPYYSGMATAIEQQAAERGYRVLLSNSMRIQEQELKGIDGFLSRRIDGVLISAGPGNPEDYPQIVETVKALMAAKPVMGVGLGHLLMALASGCRVERMRFGHHGGNQPVKDLAAGTCAVTSQSHLYAVSGEALPAGVRVSHINWNDRSIEGLVYEGREAFSVQFIPSGLGGPFDTTALFDNFLNMVRANREKAGV